MEIKITGLDRIYISKQLLQYIILFLRYLSFKKIFNLLLCEYELKRKKIKLRSMPYFLKIEPTNLCNLRCSICPRERIEYERGYISFENFKKIFNQFKDYLFLFAPHLWGEPLLHKEICKMVEYANKNNVATYISSNLHFENKKLCQELIECKLDLLTVSLDGASQETYKLNRNNGDFNIVLSNLRTLVKGKKRLKSKTPLIELQFIVLKNNEHEIDKIKKLAKDIGVDSLKIKPDVVEKERLPENNKYRFKEYVKERKKKKTCWWLWKTATISWNGLVFPCCRKIFKKPFGNVIEMSFSKIWNSKIYVNSRKCFSSNEKLDTPCEVCGKPYGSLIG